MESASQDDGGVSAPGSTRPGSSASSNHSDPVASTSHHGSSNSRREGPGSEAYNVPPGWATLTEVAAPGPTENVEEEPVYTHQSMEQTRRTLSQNRRRGSADDTQGAGRRGRIAASHASDAGAYTVPEGWVNLNEVAATGPTENVTEAPLYVRQSLDETRAGLAEERRRESVGEAEETADQVDARKRRVSRLATETYTISYLIFFAILGTLARVGLTALTSYRGAPVIFSSVWANFAGSLIMGILSEDRMLFRDEWGTPTYDQLIALAKLEQNGSHRSSRSSRAIDLVAAKRAHLATKKTIPLYIGLSTGFCGSFTSFSAFIRDVFLALSNSLTTPGLGSPQGRNGGYSFMALVAVIITTVALSLAGLILGSHLAIAVERFMPSIPYPVTRKILDPLALFLGWGCWLGAVLMTALPPENQWRGEVLFALVFGPLGCILRFYLAVLLNGKIPAFPLGTFAANIFGTAVLGMAWDIAHVPLGGHVGCQVLQGIEDGFCGCLTTISTWVTELVSLKRKHAYSYGTTSVVVATAFLIVIMGGLRWTHGFSGLECKS